MSLLVWSAVLVIALCSALAVVASASPQFAVTAQVNYFSQKPGTSSGFQTLITWTDPGEPHGKPKAVKNFRFEFHPGTRFDTAALRRCKASDSDVRRLGPRACPKASTVGSGHTEGEIPTGAGFTTDVTLFNARGQLIVLVQVAGRTITEFRDAVKGGTIAVHSVIPAGISLTKLDLRFPAHSRRVGKRRRVYMRTPRSCPKTGNWTTTISFAYVDGSSQTQTSGTACSP